MYKIAFPINLNMSLVNKSWIFTEMFHLLEIEWIYIAYCLAIYYQMYGCI